jgi:hypothetical protein
MDRNTAGNLIGRTIVIMDFKPTMSNFTTPLRGVLIVIKPGAGIYTLNKVATMV